MKKLLIKAILLSLSFSLLFSCKARGVSRASMVEFDFKGTANGGTLIIGNTLGRNSYFSAVETYKGEPVESIIEKIARDIAYNENLFEKPDNRTTEEFARRFLSDGTLKMAGIPGWYYITGTETGLGIPEPPKFLSCRYDKSSETITVKWVNPSDNYDKIMLKTKWNKYDAGSSNNLPGNTNEYVLERKNTPYDIDDLDIWIIGFKNGLPSGPACITLSENGTAQQELGGIPFKNGIAPNWEAWDTNNVKYSNFASLAKKEFVPTKERYHNIENKSDKPYSQILKTPVGGGTTGVYRKFLGLVPGHTYRLSARINTFNMKTSDSDWSFSFHVAYNSPNGSDLTKNQLAGLVALPNGKKGLEAAQVASYGQGKTTNGKFIEHATEFTLPEGVDTVTVWFRYSSSSSTGGVGFDWIKLEDISAR